MTQEINIEAILKEMREVIGAQAQEIAILKAHINSVNAPQQGTTENANS